MGTTVSLSEATKDRLRDHRVPSHESWDDTVNDLLDIVPPTGEVIGEGFIECGETRRNRSKLPEIGGFIEFEKVEVEEMEGMQKYSNYFCSDDCLRENLNHRRSRIPERPQTVLVGGRAEMRAEIEDAIFHVDGSQRSVGIGIPGAFTGKGRHSDGEYDYVGEPVYVQNEHDEWVHTGVVGEIIHEETHTSLILGSDAAVEMLNHPDEERREEYKKSHQRNDITDCNECGEGVFYVVEDAPDECPNCGSENW